MPERLFFAYADNIDPLRKERMLDAAECAMYPHLSKNNAQQWWSSLFRQTQQSARAAVAASVNNMAQVKSFLRSVLGSGFSE